MPGESPPRKNEPCIVPNAELSRPDDREVTEGGSREEALGALLLEYRKAIHDLSNILAAASMRLELYDATVASSTQSEEAAELAGAMREAISNCSGVIERLYAVREGRSMQ